MACHMDSHFLDPALLKDSETLGKQQVFEAAMHLLH